LCYVNGVRVSMETYIRYKEKLLELKEINARILNQPVKNGFEYVLWPVIKPMDDVNDFNLLAMEWGFIPGYLKDMEAVKRFRFGYKDAAGKFHAPYTTLNAVGESLLDDGKMFRTAAKNNRCIILSSGFYEYRHIKVMGKKGKELKHPQKFPYFISVKDKPYFFMAGIFNTWTDQSTGETIDSFAIVTTKANSLMQQVHNSKQRMPVILPQALAEEWTNKNLSEERIKELSSFQFPANEIQAYTVAKDFLQIENPETRFDYEQLPELLTPNS